MKNKKYLFIVLIFLTLNISINAENHNRSTITEQECKLDDGSSSQTKSPVVYVCMGPYAYAYHSNPNCPGLNNCKGDIKYMDEYTAVNTLGRKPCCRCWSNVEADCKDDNPYYGSYVGGGGDNSDAYAYVALAIVATGAILLSNDFYIYPAYSFYKGSNKTYNSEITNGMGWIFGFRKTFRHSALEYGASYMNFTMKDSYYFNSNTEQWENNYNGNTYEAEKWGSHFNFVQQIFYYKTPYWLKFYLGPSVNYVFDFGYGGIVGSEMKIFDRLKFDLRYEYTTQTNQVQAGFIFTFQKKYFWKK